MEKFSDIQIQEQRQAFASSRNVPHFVQRMKKGKLTRDTMRYSESQNPNQLSSVFDYLTKKDDIECFLPNDAGLSEIRLFDVNPLPPIPSNFLEGNRARQLAGRHSQPAAFLTKRTRGRKRHTRHIIASNDKLELVATTLNSKHLRVPLTTPQLTGPMKPDCQSSIRTNEQHYLNNYPIKQREKFERLPDNAFEMPDDRLSLLEQQSYVLHPNEADHKQHHQSLAGSGEASAESNIRKLKSRAHTHAGRLFDSRSNSERRPGGSRQQQLHAFQSDDERAAVIGFRPQETRTLAAAPGSSSGEMVAAGGEWRTLANKGSAHGSAAAAVAAVARAEDNDAGGNVRRRESPEHLPYESPFHMPLETFLALNGAVATLYPKSDMAAQITLLKSLLMPEFARELYVGRGLRLPETHHLVNPKLKEFAPLPPGVVPAEDTVQRTSNEQESAAPAMKLASGEESKGTSKLHQSRVTRLVAVLRPIDGPGSDRQNALRLPPLVGNAALPGRMSRSLSSQPEPLKWGSPPLPDLTIPADSKGKELQLSSTPEAIISGRLPPLDMSVVGHSPNRFELASTVSTSRLGPLPDTQRLLPAAPVEVSTPAAVAPPSTEPITNARTSASRVSHEELKKASASASASGGVRELSDLHERILQVISRDHSAAAFAAREPSAVVARAPAHTPELNDGGIFGMRRSRSLLVSASATAPLARSKSLHDCDSGGSIRAARNREEQPAQQEAASAYTDS